MPTKRLLAALLVAAPLVSLPGCWPLGPVAAIAAAGGGGGGGSGAKGAALLGSIVTDGSSLTALKIDREPNDTLGDAEPLPFATAARPRRGEGECAATLQWHALLDAPQGAELLGVEALAGTARSHRVGGDARTIELARRGRELLLLRAGDDGIARVDVTPLVDGFVKRTLALELPVSAAGATCLLDALIVLDTSTPDARLALFDADDGSALALHDLGRSGLGHLAGAAALADGRERLFTCEPASGRIFEIELAADGPALGLRGLRELPIAGGAVAALAYDGLHLHVARANGDVASYDEQGREVGRRRLARAGAVRSLVATLDLGIDAWHVEVPAGATLRVSLAASAAAGERATLVLAAAPRAACETGPVEPVELRRIAAGAGADGFELVAGERPTGFDLYAAALEGRARYQLALGAAARAPAAPEAAPAADAGLTAALVAGLRTLGTARLAAIHGDPLLADFVPGRLLVGRREGVGSLSLPAIHAGLALRKESGSPSGFDRVDVTTTAQWRGPAARSVNGIRSRRALRREQARALLVACDALAGARDVAWREPDFLARALATPNDPGYAANQSWHYEMLNLPAAWDLTTGSASTILAVVDTGVRDDNVDLAGNLGPDGYDFITGSNSGDGDGRDGDPFDEGSFAGNSHHGSHCGGTMGAQGNNATQGSGICWEAELMQLRALGIDGVGSISDIAEAIRYAARLSNASGLLPAARAAVINLSLGIGSPSTTLRNAVDAAIAAGVIVCGAAGNDGNGEAVLYPAAYDEVIAVAAVDFFGDVAFYSNTGPEVDVACSGGSNVFGQPARDVWSNSGVGAGGSLQPLAGTSMACAHASGVAGLIVTQFPGIGQAALEQLLRDTAVDIEGVGFDQLSGHGLVDAGAAVNDATAVLELPTGSIDFGQTGTRLLLQARNAGGGQLDVDAITLNSITTPLGVPPTTAWLDADPLPDGLTWQLTALRGGLAAGDYEIRVDVESNGGTESMAVTLDAGSPGPSDVGDVLVQIVADDGVTVVKSATARFAAGYAFSLAGVARGRYFVRCGVDLDDDGVIGEIGEPYGAYPNVADEALLEIGNADLGLDLVLE